jgi:hypothetical protein
VIKANKVERFWSGSWSWSLMGWWIWYCSLFGSSVFSGFGF